MLQSVLFRVMNTSIVGTSCDIGFYSCYIGLWKDGGPRKIVPQDPSKPYPALGGIAPWPRSWLKVGSVQLLNNFNSNLTLFFKTVVFWCYFRGIFDRLSKNHALCHVIKKHSEFFCFPFFTREILRKFRRCTHYFVFPKKKYNVRLTSATGQRNFLLLCVPLWSSSRGSGTNFVARPEYLIVWSFNLRKPFCIISNKM